MFLPMIAVYGVGIVLVVVVVRLLARRRGGGPQRHAGAIGALFDAARRRALLALGVAVTVFLAAVAAGTMVIGWLGLPALVAPALAGAVGLLVYAAVPPRAPAIADGEIREVVLVPRTIRCMVSRPLAVMFGGVLSLLVALLLFTGLTSARDSTDGLWRVISVSAENVSSTAGPYIGWSYGVPALVATAALIGALVFVLRRVSATPALPRAEHAALDLGWRRASNRVLIVSATAALLAQIAVVATPSGLTMRSAVRWEPEDIASIGIDLSRVRLDAMLAVELPQAAWDALGGALVLSGLVAAVASLVCVTLSALWAISLPDDAGVIAARLRAGGANASGSAARTDSVREAGTRR